MVENWAEYLRERRRKRKLELEQLPKMPCACGCGQLITPEDAQGRIVRYARGHSRKNIRLVSDEHKSEVRAQAMQRFRDKRQTEIAALPKILCACGCGEMIAPVGLDGRPRRYKKGHATIGKKRGPAHNRLGDRPLTEAEKTKRHIEKKRRLSPMAECACGCGIWIASIGATGQPVKYAHGHNPDGQATRFQKGRKTWNKDLPAHLQPGWKGGVGALPYGPEFTRKLKRAIRKRDNYTCQRCGITQVELGTIMQVHHLDHDKFNNDPSNLVCSCHRCNIWASNNRDKPFSL